MAECYLYRLPNELLLHLFAPIPTPELLRYTVLSRRIYTILLRILHNRLVAAAELHSYTLLLECYHPSAKLTEPSYFCAYRGTDGLSLYGEFDETGNNVGRLGEMYNLYTRFRPHRRELEAGGRRVLLQPGDVLRSRTFPGMVQDRYQGDTVTQTLGLEAPELFTQLVAQTNLVKIGPHHGLFTCIVGVEEGVVRVWRKWLADMAVKGKVKSFDSPLEAAEEPDGGIARETIKARADLEDERILWVSPSRNSGIRFNVKEKKYQSNAPILIRADEDMPANYEIEYDELLIRTSHLLLTLEESMMQEDNSSGKAVIFGPFG